MKKMAELKESKKKRENQGEKFTFLSFSLFSKTSAFWRATQKMNVGRRRGRRGSNKTFFKEELHLVHIPQEMSTEEVNSSRYFHYDPLNFLQLSPES